MSGTAPAPRLSLRGVSKSFGPTRALHDVDLQVTAGEAHALIGENGAGKSTLMKILSGAHLPDAGVIELDGRPFRPGNPLRARSQGVVMIHQELQLAPHLSVQENLLLGTEPARWGWIRSARCRELAAAALTRLGRAELDLDVPVGRLSVAQQQIVEIGRALIGNSRVMMLDEPTSSLSPVDAAALFEVIAQLRAAGVALIYSSHYLEECQRLCGRYTVLRDGENVAAGSMQDVGVADLVRHMVGREIGAIYPARRGAQGEVALSVAALAGARGPSDVSFELRRGEIFGIAGLMGAGRTETLRTLFGLDPMTAGRVAVFSRPAGRATPWRRLRQGIGLLSEDRKEEGLLLNQSIADNLTMTRYRPFCRFGLISRRRQREVARRWIDELEVKAHGPFQSIGELSGGNQQKVALGRLLHHDAAVLLLDEPTRGIDVGSKVQLYRTMGELAQAGKSLVLVSSYLPELLGMCDRIGVMRDGRLGEVRAAEAWSEQEIMVAAVGRSAAA